jgi:hypothetical protein
VLIINTKYNVIIGLFTASIFFIFCQLGCAQTKARSMNSENPPTAGAVVNPINTPTSTEPFPTLPAFTENTISGPGPLPLQISIDPYTFAGAISSLIWNGKEFVNIHDHGRQIQTAVQFDGFAECNNPTEAGASADGKKKQSTSKLINFSKKTSSAFYAKTQMAYWSYNKLTGACTKGLDARVTSRLSNTILEKTVEIGALNDPQIIGIDLKITHAEGNLTTKVIYEILTGYLTSEFSRFFYVSHENKNLIEYTGSDLVDISGNGFPNGSFQPRSPLKKKFDPVIVSTPATTHAMGVYIPSKQIINCKGEFGYALFHFNLGGSGANGPGTNKWNIAAYDSADSPCIVNNSRSFKVYLAIGTLSQVHTKLTSLINFAP